MVWDIVLNFTGMVLYSLGTTIQIQLDRSAIPISVKTLYYRMMNTGMDYTAHQVFGVLERNGEYSMKIKDKNDESFFMTLRTNETLPEEFIGNEIYFVGDAERDKNGDIIFKNLRSFGTSSHGKPSSFVSVFILASLCFGWGVIKPIFKKRKRSAWYQVLSEGENVNNCVVSKRVIESHSANIYEYKLKESIEKHIDPLHLLQSCKITIPSREPNSITKINSMETVITYIIPHTQHLKIRDEILHWMNIIGFTVSLISIGRILIK